MKARFSSAVCERSLVRGILLAILLSAAIGPVVAVDGVMEINQAKVMASGGFPYVINQPGSYRLTGNLDVSGETDPQDVTAIRITVDKVTLDLNGFAIIGPNDCQGTGTNLNCDNVGLGKGVDGSFDNTVKNGRVEGMGGEGISLNVRSTVDGVTVVSNGDTGITVASRSTITDCKAIQNNGAGLAANRGIVSGSVSFGNASRGIVVSETGLARDNVARFNGDHGLFLGTQTGYVSNVASFNEVGEVSGGVQLGSNLCGSALCP
jgi:hypothetical protein